MRIIQKGMNNWKSNSIGRVAEWLKALVLKTSNRKLFVGSNPTSSATLSGKFLNKPGRY